ncbi:auxin-responsive protein SAUR36-like [Musa acuminata AAA Group]|uniref:auxin-responsive protein SAUR36-like n=1 Tax=Musa acuminata AAA Group TaxID=214697 RepID=UPI0031DF9E0D
MKRYRGFKLGRRLVRVWRWVLHRRSRRVPRSYLRLDSTTDSISKSLLSGPSTTMTTKLVHWGRHLASRLRRGRSAGGGGSGSRRMVCARGSADEVMFGAGVPLLEREGGRGWTPPPKGHLAVYVGGEKEGGPPRRYTVPVIYFNHPLFGELLRESEEEFGFHHPGGITIPCPAAKFELVRTRIAAAAHNNKLRR